MINFPSGLAAHVLGDTTTLAYAFKVKRVDVSNNPVVMGFTLADRDAEFDGVLYRSSTGISTSAMEYGTGLVAGHSEIYGFFALDAITENDILAGLWDTATVEIYLYNWANIADGQALISKARISEIRIEGRKFVAELSDLIDQLNVNIGDVTSPTCRTTLFSAKCKVRSNPPAWSAGLVCTANALYDAALGTLVKPTTPNRYWYRCTTGGTAGGAEPTWTTTEGGTTSDGPVVWTTQRAFVQTGIVAAVTNNRVFTDSAIIEPNDFFSGGKIVWLTGANAGRKMEIKTQTGTTVSIFLPMLSPIEVGDTFEIYAGCYGRLTDCKDKFLNTYNMRAEPNKPRSDLIYSYAAR